MWSTPLGLPGGCGIYACTNIQHVASEEEEEEEEEVDTPHINARRNARVWVDFFDGLL